MELHLRNKLNERTDMLCEILTKLENNHPKIYSELVATDIVEWHKEHKIFDAGRNLK